MKKLLIALVVLALLAVVADRVAERVVGDKVATMVQDREGLAATPTVEFAGFPFLTQVLANDFQSVRMTLPGVDAQAGDTESIRVDDIAATFFDVKTSNRFRAASAARMTGSALVRFDSISELGDIRAAYGGETSDGTGLMAFTSDALEADGVVKVGVAVQNGSLSFAGTDGTTRIRLPQNLRPALETFVLSAHPLSGLPQSFTVDSVTVAPEGVRLKLSARDIALAS